MQVNALPPLSGSHDEILSATPTAKVGVSVFLGCLSICLDLRGELPTGTIVSPFFALLVFNRSLLATGQKPK